MNSRSCLTALAALGFFVAPQVSAQADLHVYYESSLQGEYKLTAQLTEGVGTGFALLASFGGDEFEQAGSVLVAVAPLDNTGFGRFEIALPVDLMSLPESSRITFAALYKDNGIVLTPQADMVLGKDVVCEGLDFQFTLGPDDGEIMQAGRVIDEQWAGVGMHITADNKAVAHPDKAILFDSDNPTGGDDDLGVNLGLGLIIAENDWDGDQDGLVDDPDDEMKGGSIYFDFDEPATVCSVRLVDIDEIPGTQLRFYRNGDLVNPTDTMTVLSVGDGEVQDVFFHEEKVDRFEVFFKGSGMVGAAELIVCPQFIDFDETTLGKPLGFEAGEWITDQFDEIGVHISAENAGSGGSQNHPDKAILFDTSNPTGDDFDLMTPNPANPTNNEALGLVFIIAEDDFDADQDGLVDEPDDEQKGGVMRFDFDYDVTFDSLKVLDCDGVEKYTIRMFDKDDVELGAWPLPDLADGSVQTVSIMQSGVRSAVFEMGGSGAVTRIKFCPDPTGDE